jgi:hypothetical protein
MYHNFNSKVVALLVIVTVSNQQSTQQINALLTVLPSQHQVELELSTKAPSKNKCKKEQKNAQNLHILLVLSIKKGFD